MLHDGGEARRGSGTGGIDFMQQGQIATTDQIVTKQMRNIRGERAKAQIGRSLLGFQTHFGAHAHRFSYAATFRMRRHFHIKSQNL